MSFANTKREYPANPNFVKATWLNLSPGNHMVRLLNSDAVRYDTHWINGNTILCLGENCPICETNRRVRLEHNNKDYYNLPDYHAVVLKFFVNVLDRTPVKVCPNCQAEVNMIPSASGNSTFPSTCPTCNHFVTEVAAGPSNKVKILSRGTTLFDQFNSAQNPEIDDEGNTIPPEPITSYDFALICNPANKKNPVVAQPKKNRNDVVEVPADSLYSLESRVIKLEPVEIADLLKGISIRDIFAARKAKGGQQTTELEQKSAVLSTEINSTISKLFDTQE
jgi:hypothetical protein